VAGVVAPAADHDHRRERERDHEREAVAHEAALTRRTEHHRHTGERERHRRDRAPRDRLPERDPGEQRREHGGHGQDEQDARHARVIERGDEAAGGDRDADGHRDAGQPDRAECLGDPPALDDRDIRQQRGAGEHRPPEDLGRRVERELALEHAGARPRDRRERDVDLTAALAP
jgi:hypothetical protein